MASIWMLSKESMKGMDIVSVLTDVLYAIEQTTGRKNAILADDIRDKFHRGKELILLMAASVEGQTQKGKQIDLFMLRVVESLEKSLGLSPTLLFGKLQTAVKELDSGSVSSETTRLLEMISETAMNMTSRSVEQISTSLR